MNDRQLLEAAARAAGIPLRIWGTGKNECITRVTGPDMGETWNPLHDDGDALRLSALAEVDVWHADGIVYAGDAYTRSAWGECPAGDDRATAMRHAIVRAAAAMAPKEP